MRSAHENNMASRVSAATMAVTLMLGGGAIVATSASASGSASSVAKGIALAKSRLANFTKIPTFKAPGPAFNAKKIMKNKIILPCDCGEINPAPKYAREVREAQPGQVTGRNGR
jgi:hypothetical protein